MNKKPNLIALVAVVVTAVLALVAGYAWGSGKTDESSTTASPMSLSSIASKANPTDHNSADGMCAMMMTEQHTQAIEMAKLAPSRTRSAPVKDLASRIEAAQFPEMQKMSGWMNEWGTSGDMDSLHRNMDGAMSAQDMKSLEAASGADFDKMFSEMMIKHYLGAIEMANSEVRSGKNGEALALAASIAVSQQSEITLMRSLLKSS